MLFFVHVLYPSSTPFSAREDEVSEFDEVPGQNSGETSGKIENGDKKGWRKKGKRTRKKRYIMETPSSWIEGWRHTYYACSRADALAKS